MPPPLFWHDAKNYKLIPPPFFLLTPFLTTLAYFFLNAKRIQNPKGPNFEVAYNWVKNVSSLPVHYEGSSWGGDAGSTDFDSCMYCRVNQLGRFPEKPFLLCE